MNLQIVSNEIYSIQKARVEPFAGGIQQPKCHKEE